MLRSSASRSAFEVLSTVIAGVLDGVVHQLSPDVAFHALPFCRFNGPTIPFVERHKVRLLETRYRRFQIVKRIKTAPNGKRIHVYN